MAGSENDVVFRLKFVFSEKEKFKKVMKRINEEIMDIAEINRVLRESGKLKRILGKSTKQDKTLTKGAREFFTKNIKRMIPGGEGYRPAKRILKEAANEWREHRYKKSSGKKQGTKQSMVLTG